MEKETLRTRSYRPKNDGSLYASLCAFNLPILIENMKNQHTWSNGELNTMVLLKSPYKQIVLTTMHGGTEIKSFQSNNSITFQIIEGKLKFHTKFESITLEKGQLLSLHENIKYRLTTKEETVLLLTIANDTLQNSKKEMVLCL